MVKIACWSIFKAAIDRKSDANTQPNHRAETELGGFSGLLEEIAVAQGCLERCAAHIGAQHKDAVVVGLVGQLAGIDLEGAAALSDSEITAVSRVRD